VKGTAGGPAYPAASPSSVSIYFAKGQASLDTDAQRAVRVATAMYVGIGTQVLVTGYADKTGNAAANVELAKKRAVAVRDELVKLGVESKRIQLVPPVTVTGADSDDQARRVDLSVNQ
jgi:outer membrane protein OmpA-like peptidoglycan-associated protein